MRHRSIGKFMSVRQDAIRGDDPSEDDQPILGDFSEIAPGKNPCCKLFGTQ